MLNTVNSRYLMHIPVKNNTNYGGSLINQKYAPLDINAVEIEVKAETEYKKLFNERITLLKKKNLLPNKLNLYANNWTTIQTNESATRALPPIVVVSSNRAKWMKEKYEDVASELLAQKNLTNFDDVNDIRALEWGPTLWYDPRRINDANRHVYIVVHQVEYENYYEKQLKNTDMTIIGWAFEANSDDETYVGFGASRFAAIEFCKYVFNVLCKPPLGAARQKAWLVDDNVVYVQGFPGFTTAEGKMNADVWGLGFKGATKNSTDDEIKELKVGTKDAMTNLDDKGLLQQCVLWNIYQLNKQYLNFSPYFVSSNEDTSFSNYLQEKNRSKLRVSSGATVFKAIPNNGPDKKLGPLRKKAVENFYEIEKNCPVESTDPQQTNKNDPTQGTKQNLSDYITNYVLPNAQEGIRSENKKLTQSKAVEQITAKVVKDKINWVPDKTFKPNDNHHQNTEHQDVIK